jgi:cell division protein FtsI (penicillin-binding protein 3)
LPKAAAQTGAPAMAAPKPTERKYLHRILLVAMGLSLPFGGIVARMYHLQVVRHEYYRDRAEDQHVKTVKITPLRGSILSALGSPLAASSFRETAYIAPRYIDEDPLLRRKLAQEIADCLSMPSENVNKLMAQEGEPVLKRKLEETEVLQLIGIREEFDLPRPALYFVKEGKRFYPQGELASHVVGFTRSDDFGDNIGVEGAEAGFNQEIAGSYGKEKVEVNVVGQILSPIEEDSYLRAAGNDVYLTIHEGIQHYTETALKKQVELYQARGGVCVVMEVGTGAILAMASEPTFDLNAPGDAPGRNRKNQCLVDSIYPGSVMKVFTAATLLENNQLSPYEMVNCENGRKVFVEGRLRRTIKDSHRMGIVTVLQAFAESSNVAWATLGQRLDKEVFYNQLRKFGFGSRTEIDLPGEGCGIMHPLKDWDAGSRISLPIGYEITLTPVQVAAAMAAIANNGEYVRPHVLKEVRSPKGELLYRAQPVVVGRVCSPQTTKILLDMMEEVVQHGTGKEAALPGYRIAGKTGTTVKQFGSVDDPNKDAYYGSFLGVFPAEAPRVVVYAWIDEPKEDKFGGTVAAPICRMVAEHATRILGIEPTMPIPSEVPRETDEPQSPETMIVETNSLSPALPDGDLVLMCDLKGLTLREAVEKLNEMKMDADLVGTGVVIQQQPPPQTPVDTQARALVVFGMKE